VVESYYSYYSDRFMSADAEDLHPMPDFPLDCDLVIKEIPAEQSFFRIHETAFGAIYFSGLVPGQESRFCAPQQEYGTLYVAEDICVAFRETVMRSTYGRVSEAKLLSRCLSEIKIQRNLRLADLTGAGLTRLGADARIVTDSSDHYRVSRQWALRLWQHSARVDGLYYRSRYDPSRFCLVLFSDRLPPNLLSEIRTTVHLMDEAFLPQLFAVLDMYGYGLG
jgi:hypothetical protein